MTPLDAPLWAPTWYTGQQPKRRQCSTLIDFGCSLISMILLTQIEFWCGTGTIWSSMKLFFHPYKERPKRTSYATWALFLVRATPGLRGGLELELFWVSTLATRSELVLGLLIYLDTLDGLLLHVMRQSWCVNHGHMHGCHVLIGKLRVWTLMVGTQQVGKRMQGQQERLKRLIAVSILIGLVSTYLSKYKFIPTHLSIK
jgi:hypothetical protein